MAVKHAPMSPLITIRSLLLTRNTRNMAVVVKTTRGGTDCWWRVRQVAPLLLCARFLVADAMTELKGRRCLIIPIAHLVEHTV